LALIRRLRVVQIHLAIACSDLGNGLCSNASAVGIDINVHVKGLVGEWRVLGARGIGSLRDGLRWIMLKAMGNESFDELLRPQGYLP
jgi:hypothetical protein